MSFHRVRSVESGLGSHAVVLPAPGPLQLQSIKPLVIPSEQKAPTVEAKMQEFLGRVTQAAEDLPVQERAEMSERVGEWKLLFSQDKPMDPTSREERILTAHRICFVHWNLERIISTYAQVDDRRHPWEGLALELREQLLTVVPEDLNAETFRATFELQLLVDRVNQAAEGLLPECRDEVVNAVYEWQQVFFQDNPIAPSTPQERVSAAYDLCLLQRNLEVAMLYYAQETQDKLVWDSLVMEVGRLMSDILPEGQNAKDFRATYEERLVEQGLLAILPLIQEFRERLYASVNQLSEELAVEYERAKDEMRTVHVDNQLSQQRVHALVREMTERVADLYQDFGKNVGDIKALVNRIVAIEAAVSQNLIDLENALRRV